LGAFGRRPPVVGLAHLKNAQVQDSISHLREEIEEKVAREIAGPPTIAPLGSPALGHAS
jgi:hypothetical protein